MSGGNGNSTEINTEMCDEDKQITVVFCGRHKIEILLVENVENSQNMHTNQLKSVEDQSYQPSPLTKMNSEFIHRPIFMWKRRMNSLQHMHEDTRQHRAMKKKQLKLPEMKRSE